MSAFEVLSIIVACLALAISLLALSAQKKLQREANELQRVTAELSKKQLELIENQERISVQAQLAIKLTSESRGYTVVIRNVGQVEAKDVEIQSLGEGVEELLISPEEVREKFPLKKFRPGEEVRLSAGVYMDGPSVFRLLLRWRNADGKAKEEEYRVSV